MTISSDISGPFFGWRVVAGAFVLAILGWGLGFYGPPVYLHAVREMRGWSVALVSAAVTVHYLCGAVVVANLPGLYRRLGFKAVTRCGAVALALGLLGWASAQEPWQLFIATILTGSGWVTMGAAAINAIIAPWFVVNRPKALSTAYNGASVGGIIFAPLWVALIGWAGFQFAALIIGGLTMIIVWFLTECVVGFSPADRGQQPDGGAITPISTSNTPRPIPPLPGASLWQDKSFRTLAAGMALGLFAQIGLLAHLFSLIVPALGTGWAGVVMGLATASAITGRTAFGWLMPASTDRRLAAALSYGIQILGAGVLILSGTQEPALIILGILLFGFGIGNATSLPPLIAQVEFAKEDVSRVVPLIVAMAQATYAFAPAVFGLVREAFQGGVSGPSSEGIAILILVMGIKGLAISALLLGRYARRSA